MRPRAVFQLLRRHLAPLRGPGPLVALPPLLTVGWLLAGPVGLLAAMSLAPVMLAVLRRRYDEEVFAASDPLTALRLRADIVAAIDRALRSPPREGEAAGALVLEIDRWNLLQERFDRNLREAVLKSVADRMRTVLPDCDLAARLDGPIFALALSPARRLDLEAVIQVSSRLQTALAEPVAVDAVQVHLTASVGFALSGRIERPDGETMLQAAKAALVEAQRSGPAAIRSYSKAMRDRIEARSAISREVGRALDAGEIEAFYQPQISTRTGAITGFETLARWKSPSRGLVPPIEFLPALEEAGLMARLGEKMLDSALGTLRDWDDRSLHVPRIAINVSAEDLRDPRLVERIRWALDRYSFAPDRLSLEVLETVAAGGTEEAICATLAGLAELGCGVDLDDFGTGHASITTIRQFSIERIKIDRSFVARIDADPEQQQMVAAILTMADRLGLDTLAEGVETAEERAMLARLGCGHVQGYGIGRPMPAGEAAAWIAAYQSPDPTLVPFRRRA